MKKVLMAMALCLMCAAVFTSCKSKEQKITENYIKEHDLPVLMAGASFINAEITTYEVSDFNNTPTDTMFEWQVFEKYDLQSAADAYIFNLKCLADEMDFAYNMNNLYGDCFDSKTVNNRIDSLINKTEADSIAYAEAGKKWEKLKKDKDIRALGYTFTLHTKIKMAGQEIEKDQQKVIYIMDNDKVYSCVDK